MNSSNTVYKDLILERSVRDTVKVPSISSGSSLVAKY